MIRSILDDAAGPAREIVILNAAAALWTAERGTRLECAQRAREAISSGAAKDTLRRLVEVSHA